MLRMKFGAKKSFFHPEKTIGLRENRKKNRVFFRRPINLKIADASPSFTPTQTGLWGHFLSRTDGGTSWARLLIGRSTSSTRPCPRQGRPRLALLARVFAALALTHSSVCCACPHTQQYLVITHAPGARPSVRPCEGGSSPWTVMLTSVLLGDAAA